MIKNSRGGVFFRKSIWLVNVGFGQYLSYVGQYLIRNGQYFVHIGLYIQLTGIYQFINY
ncbi:hypothetical protein [Planococcus versutus]|uniref:hypothetical protein n=1 Tax=Planococcus versutus TaxID=1302659 RepID=UPI000A6E7C6F|nr:hypothetical protein [Planococcus versutus]